MKGGDWEAHPSQFDARDVADKVDGVRTTGRHEQHPAAAHHLDLANTHRAQARRVAERASNPTGHSRTTPKSQKGLPPSAFRVTGRVMDDAPGATRRRAHSKLI